MKSRIKGVLAIKGIPKITHPQFIDDTILPGESNMEEDLNLKKNINTYVEALGKM